MGTGNLQFAQNAMAAGAAAVQLEVFPNMWHDFEMSSAGCGADHALGEGLTTYRLAATFLKEGGRGGCHVVCGDGDNTTCEGVAPVRWHLHYNSLPPVQSSGDCPASYL